MNVPDRTSFKALAKESQWRMGMVGGQVHTGLDVRWERRLVLGLLWLVVAIAGTVLVAAAYRTTQAVDLRNPWIAAQAFIHGRPPYAGLFLYPPSSLILLSPLGFVSFQAARLAFALMDAIAVLGGALVCLRIFRVPLTSLAAPLLCLMIVCFSPVGSDIHLGNVNSVLLLAEAAAIYVALRDRWLAAGVLIGLSLALKPVLIPLLLLFVLWRRWHALAIALAVPIVLSAIGLAMLPDRAQFFSHTLPYLLTANALVFRDFNASLYGAGQLLDAPGWAVLAMRAAVLTVGLGLAAVRLRRGGDRALQLVDCASLLLLAGFLGLQFTWSTYGIYFIPLLVSLVVRTSVMRHPLAWVAVLLMGSPDVWLWEHHSTFATHLAALRVTAGMLALLGAFLVREWRSGLSISGIAGREAVGAPPGG